MNKESNISFEEQLRQLRPASASRNLKAKLKSSLGEAESHPERRAWWLAGVTSAAAAITVAAVVIPSLVDSPSVAVSDPSANTQEAVEFEQVVLSTSEPTLVEFPDSDPMWEIEMQLLNRSLIESPKGVMKTHYQPERRKVFVPAVFR